ncbi:MAG: glycine zipper 2TM domain-containing protein [Gammaproteobacteria bacterium]|nr:glycine zipper 2TM domain-containing protein [Gammaproteobacteria bacterium]MCP5415494.1 glycine zipper 2TM domain-containing protein [Chromatiaceae bacterium]
MGSISNKGRVFPATFFLAIAIFSAGCETTSNRDMGTAVGALLGGLLGSQIDDKGGRGALIGALVGGVVGRMIGHYMDESDKQRLVQTIDEGPRGRTVSWRNEQSGNEFEVTPTSDYYVQNDRQCRQFDQVVYVDGRREVMQGVACKSPGSDELAIEGTEI